MAKRFCEDCKHFGPLYLTGQGFVIEEWCKANAADTYRAPAEKHAAPRQKNQNNDCGDFEVRPPKPKRRGFWARLFQFAPRPGFNPPPVQNVVKPPAPPMAPEPGKLYVLEPGQRAPRPAGAVMPEIKPPPEPAIIFVGMTNADLRKSISGARHHLERLLYVGSEDHFSEDSRFEEDVQNARKNLAALVSVESVRAGVTQISEPIPFPTPEPSEGESSERPI
jgi:hypothetical protein